jgi:prepilin-type N-terminal cleavage/methylation domain-containing protein
MAKIMHKLKQKAGFTLIELCVVLGLMAMVVWIAGGAVYMAGDSYALTTRMQDDEYAARTAMLNISREMHRGWSMIAFVEAYEEEIPPGSGNKVYFPAKLKLWTEVQEVSTPEELRYIDGELEYTFDDRTGELTRGAAATSGTPVFFEPLKLQSFRMDIIEGINLSDMTFDEGAIPRVQFTMVCENGLTVSTKVALVRIPLFATPPSPP